MKMTNFSHYRSAESVGELVAGAQALAEAKVDELDVAFGVQHDVLGLQVPINNVQVVQVLDGAGNFAQIKSGKGKFMF